MNSNPFSSLQNLNNFDLSKLASECGIMSGETDEEVDASIDLIKAKELAQAKLAKAKKKKEQSQFVEEVVEVDESLEAHNEEHLRIVHELEEVDDQDCESDIIEVIRLSQLGNPTNKPK